MQNLRQRKRLIWLLSVFAGVFILANVTTCFFLDVFLFQSKKLAQDHSFRFPFPFEETELTNSDGITISCLFFPAIRDSGKGIILYFHGNADNLQRWGNYSSDFTNLGYDVMMMDYRGYGKSGGKILDEKDLFSDANLLYQHMRDKFPQKEIILYGRSLGTGIATNLASYRSHSKLILETPYYSLSELIYGYAPLLPKTLCLEYDIRTDLYMRKVKTPIHIFHGTNDKVVPYREGKKLKKLMGEKVDFVTIPGGKHKNLRDFPIYHQELKRILEE